MMDEAQIDSFISEITAEMVFLRVIQNDPIVLTQEQENGIARETNASKREELRKKYIKEAEESRKLWIFWMINTLEGKIRDSGLPSKTKAELANILDAVKNNHMNLTPNTLKEMDEVLEKTNDERKIEEKKKQAEDHSIDIAPVVAVIAAPIIASAIQENRKQAARPVQTIDTVAGIPTLGENANPVYARKVKAVGNKLLGKIANKFDTPITLADIQASKDLSPLQIRYAEAAYLEQHPEVKKDLIAQETFALDKATKHSIEVHNYKVAQRKLKAAKEARRNAKTPEDILKADKEIEEATQVITSIETARKNRSRKGNTTEKEKVDAQKKLEDAQEKLKEAIRAEHNAKTPEEKLKAHKDVEEASKVVVSAKATLDNQLKKDLQSEAKVEKAKKELKEAGIALNKAKQAKRDAKTPQEEAAALASIEQAQKTFDKAKQQVSAYYNRSQYTKEEAAVMREVKKIKEKEGVALSIQEVADRLKNPTRIDIYMNIMRREHPELFQNQVEKEKERWEISILRALRRLFQKQKAMEVQNKDGKVTTKDKQEIQKETNERFNPSLRNLIRSYQKFSSNVNILANLRERNTR
ncbi:MAG: hypothetical protein J6Y03_02960 [Alphaproteobacteria bacterium]|nr:hypothetical protein [Alphaproteobacteria bacterium]